MARDLSAMTDAEVQEEVEADTQMQEANAMYSALWDECKVFSDDGFKLFMARIGEMRDRMLAGLASPNVDISLVPTLRGQLRAFEYVLKLPDELRQLRDRLGQQIATAMSDVDTEEESSEYLT